MGFTDSCVSAGLTGGMRMGHHFILTAAHGDFLSQYGYGLAAVAAAAVPAILFIRFERKRAVVEKTVMIALLSAISSVGRAVFTALPSVQPSSFIIILTGIVLGPEAGFMTGALTALLSGFMMGIGPWTLWQLLAWGLMGGMAGVLAKPLSHYKGLRIAYGALWGMLFGWIMNLWVLLSMDVSETGIKAVFAIYAASFAFDLAHAAANGLLMGFGGDIFIRVLSRIAVKYGLTTRSMDRPKNKQASAE